MSFRTIFYAGIAIMAIMRLFQLVLICQWNHRLNISDIVFAVGEGIAFSIVAQIMTMPICVLGARLCPSGIEASLYSTIMSVSNLGGLVSSYIGAALTGVFDITNHDFKNLWKLSVLCTCLSLVPLGFVHFLPNINATDTAGGMELVDCSQEHVTSVYGSNQEDEDSPRAEIGCRQTGQHACTSHAHLDTHEEQNA